jgi:hypothetical protein
MKQNSQIKKHPMGPQEFHWSSFRDYVEVGTSLKSPF